MKICKIKAKSFVEKSLGLKPWEKSFLWYLKLFTAFKLRQNNERKATEAYK